MGLRTIPLPILAFLAGALAIGCMGTRAPSPIEDRSSPTQAQRPALADSLSVLATENMATWNRLDPDRWLRLFDDDVQWYYLDKRMDLAGVEQLARSVMPELRESRTAVVGEPHVVVLGPDAAVVAFDAREYWAPKSDTIPLFERSTALTFVYQRIDGEWKVVHAHESWAEPPASDTAETAR